MPEALAFKKPICHIGVTHPQADAIERVFAPFGPETIEQEKSGEVGTKLGASQKCLTPAPL